MRISTLLSVAIAASVFLMNSSEVLAQKKGGGGKGGGGEEPASPYRLVDLLGINNGSLGYQSAGMYLSNRLPGGVLVHGESYIRQPDQSSYKVPVTWQVASDGSFADPYELGLPTFARELEPTGFNGLGFSVGITRWGYDNYFPAYVHTASHGFKVLPQGYWARSINNFGQVVGQLEDGSGGVWQVGLDGTPSQPQSLGGFQPFDINDFGVIAGFEMDSTLQRNFLAVAQFDGEQMTIHRLSDSVRAASFSGDGPRLNNCDISDPRLTVVSTSYVNDQGEYQQSDSIRAIVWRPNSQTQSLTVLGTLGSNSSYATDVNLGGEVVGYSSTKRDGHHAFVYSAGAMEDLNSVVSIGSNTLIQASSINEDGDIAGFMRIPRPVSEQRAFLLQRILP